MNRILGILIFAALTASCLGESTFNTTYIPIITFDTSDSNFNEDSLYFDTHYKIGFGWDSFMFYHKIDVAFSDFKGGFLLSALNIPRSGQTEALRNNQYRANSKGVNKFAVFALTDDMPKNHFEFVYNTSGGLKGTCSPAAVRVNNAVAVADSVRAFFVPGDKMVLRLTGYLNNKETGHSDIVLAERATDRDSIVSKWTEMNLGALGSIDEIRLDFILPEGSKVPKIACLDSLVASVNLYSE